MKYPIAAPGRLSIPKFQMERSPVGANPVKTNVAPWCYKCMEWIGIGLDGCLGGGKYRAPYGAKNLHCV